MPSTQRLWSSLDGWLQINAPVSAQALHGPADLQAIRTAEERTGLTWPQVLLDSLLVHDGATGNCEVLHGGAAPLKAVEIPQALEEMRSYYDWEEPEERERTCPSTAMPFADAGDGDRYLFDLKAGASHGSVHFWTLHAAAGVRVDEPANHASYEEWLDKTVRCLLGRETVDGWRAEVIDGQLTWDPHAEWQ